MKGIQKFIALPYTINKQSKKEMKTIPFTIILKVIKYLGISLTKKAKCLYTKSYKTLLKKIKEGTELGRHACLWIRRQYWLDVNTTQSHLWI